MEINNKCPYFTGKFYYAIYSEYWVQLNDKCNIIIFKWIIGSLHNKLCLFQFYLFNVFLFSGHILMVVCFACNFLAHLCNYSWLLFHWFAIWYNVFSNECIVIIYIVGRLGNSVIFVGLMTFCTNTMRNSFIVLTNEKYENFSTLCNHFLVLHYLFSAFVEIFLYEKKALMFTSPTLTVWR